MNYSRLVTTLEKFFSKAGASLNKKGADYKDRDVLPSFILIDEQRGSYYVLEIANRADLLPKLNQEQTKNAYKYAEDVELDPFLYNLLIFVGKKLIQFDKNVDFYKEHDLSKLELKSAAVVEDEDVESFKKILAYEDTPFQAVPLKGVFTIFFFNKLANDRIMDLAEIALKIDKNSINHTTKTESLENLVNDDEPAQEVIDSIEDIVIDDNNEDIDKKELDDELETKFLKNDSADTLVEEQSISSEVIKNEPVDDTEHTTNQDIKEEKAEEAEKIKKAKSYSALSAYFEGALASSDSDDDLPPPRIYTEKDVFVDDTKHEEKITYNDKKEQDPKAFNTDNFNKTTISSSHLKSKVSQFKNKNQDFHKTENDLTEKKPKIKEKQKQVIKSGKHIVEDNTTEDGSFNNNILNHIAAFLFFFPVYLINRITKTKLPKFVMYWFGLIIVAFGFYKFTLGNILTPLFQKIYVTLVLTFKNISAHFIQYDIIELFSNTTLPSGFSSTIATILNFSLALFAAEISFLHYLGGAIILHYMLSMAYMISIPPYSRVFGKKMIVFLLSFFFLYAPLLLMANYAMKFIVVQSAENFAIVSVITKNNSAILAAVHESVISYIAVGGTVFAILAIALLTPFLAIFFSAKITNIIKGKVTDDNLIP